MIARIIGGLSKANVAIALAIVSDTTTENERNRAMVRKFDESRTNGFLFRVDVYLSSTPSISAHCYLLIHPLFMF